MAQYFLNDVSPTFCVLPWIHVATYTDGKALLCCLAQPPKDERLNLNGATLDAVWNSYYWKKTRRDMLDGKMIPACIHCTREEKSGIRSHRMNENNLWTKKLGREYIDRLIADTKEDGELNHKIITLDLRLGNTCNVQCVMCRPTDSSKWVRDAQTIIDTTEGEVKSDWEWKKQDYEKGNFEWAVDEDFWIDEIEPLLPHMRHFIFAGGEPLYLKNHKKFLQRCVELGVSKNIELRYHTNGTIMPNDILELWSKFKFVELMLSIDGMGEQNKWLRHPTEWNTVQKTLQKVDNSKGNIVAKVLCTISAVNVYYMIDFAEWLIEQKFKKVGVGDHQGIFHPGILHYPQYMCSKVLPAEIKSIIADRVESFIEKYPNNEKAKELLNVVNFMNSEDWSDKLPALRSYIRSIDRMRNTDFPAVFPELDILWKTK